MLTVIIDKLMEDNFPAGHVYVWTQDKSDELMENYCINFDLKRF